MRLTDYIKDKFINIFTVFIGLLLILFLLVFLDAHILLKISIPMIYVILYLLIFLNDCQKRYRFYKNMSKKLDNLDKKYLITEIIKDASFIDGNIFLDYLYEIDKCYIEDINKYKISNKEFREYIELWCHEIKTPIATSKMIIDNNKNNVTSSILEETEKIESFVEQVLYYSRSETVEKDYIVTKLKLRRIIDNVIKKNKKDLISNKIKVDINDIDVIVDSDSKWLEYILNQIIVNSIKYKKDKNSYIKIYSKDNDNNVILYIEDNGIGISNDEVDRVFDKGFTGRNGRIKYVSTGMGLYLCKKLCDRLGHNINITSKEGVNTVVSIIFPKNSLTKDI